MMFSTVSEGSEEAPILDRAPDPEEVSLCGESPVVVPVITALFVPEVP